MESQRTLNSQNNVEKEKHQMLVRMWKNKNSPLLVGVKNGTDTHFQRQFGISYKSKRPLTK